MNLFIEFSGIIFITYLIFMLIDWRNIESFKFMNRSHTTLLKGFAILTVVWAHTGGVLGVGRIQFIAGIGVALFLICSGYGIMVSYQKNGLKDFWGKKLLKVVVPFWIIELVGLLATKKFDVLTYLKDGFFIVPATAYGWFMQYIVICYILFWFTLKSAEMLKLSKGQITGVMFTLFAIWFVLDSLFFANPAMPFLKARQMLSFPFGVLIAQYYEQIENSIKKKKFTITFAIIGVYTGGGMMLLTQLPQIKALSHMISNVMSLFTVLPIAIVVIALSMMLRKLMYNQLFAYLGTMSYELYLVHAFTLGIIKYNRMSIIQFLCFTVIATLVAHTINSRFFWIGFKKLASHL